MNDDKNDLINIDTKLTAKLGNNELENPNIQEAEIDDSSYFKPLESEMLEFIQDMKYGILKEKTNNGKMIPTDNRDIRVINEVSNSLVEQITKTAELRQKEKDIATTGGYTALIAEILTAHSKGNISNENVDKLVDTYILPEEYDKKEVVEGELSVNPKQKDLDSIMSLIE